MSSKAKILSRIRAQKGRGPLKSEHADILKQRMAEHQKNLIPKRGQRSLPEQVDLFQSKMEALATTVERVESAEDIPARVQEYLKQHNLPSRLKISPSEAISGLNWADLPTLEIVSGAGAEEDMVGVSPAFAGVAETGTLMMASGAMTPSTINFLPENHIAVLNISDMKGSYEEAWDALRDKMGDQGLPRTVNLISGPSRTADIEQRLIMGAHGPKRLHVILVGDGSKSE
ncbi:LutC/YkgG family protein [Sneathiella aquimaris]|uniref:LutC/YkgG family protein n=1 Tax=Sneathiella aquimaris TaxID=2599305 RepID=UPI00146EC35A|nr:LUD domain-containing protein [Sneathiella aquimaris]